MQTLTIQQTCYKCKSGNFDSIFFLIGTLEIITISGFACQVGMLRSDRPMVTTIVPH
jgi:hypothetical protein